MSKIIIIIILLTPFIFGQLQTRDAGSIKTEGVYPSSPLSQIGNNHYGFLRAYIDSLLKIKYAEIDTLKVDALELIRAYISELYLPIGAIQSSIIPNDPTSFVGTLGKPFNSGVFNHILNEESFSNSIETFNVKRYKSYHEAIEAMPDSDAVLYFPPGEYYLDGAITFYNKKRITIKLDRNAYIAPSELMTTNIASIIDTLIEGDTTVLIDKGSSSFSKIKIGMTFRNYATSAGSDSVESLELYKVTAIDTSTGRLTFYPEWDGNMKTGSIIYSAYGFDSYAYYPNNFTVQYVDTLYPNSQIMFGNSGLVFFGRGCESVEVDGGTWSEQRKQGGTADAGSGIYGMIMSHYTHGLTIKNGMFINITADGISPQYDDTYVRIQNNVFINVSGNGIHLGGQQKNAIVIGNVTVGCGAGLFYCKDVQRSIVAFNHFINSSSSRPVIFNYGDAFWVGEHYHQWIGNILQGGEYGIDIGLQSGDIYFSNNIISGMAKHGISVGAGDYSLNNSLGMWQINITNNFIYSNGGAGIYLNVNTARPDAILEAGTISGNEIFNNGTSGSFNDTLKTGIYINSLRVEKFIISNNQLFNLPDSGAYNDKNHVTQETIIPTQEYGIYASGVDKTNIYKDNIAYNNSTANFSITMGLPSASNFRNYGTSQIPWQKGTTRWNDADSKLYVWNGAAWVATY